MSTSSVGVGLCQAGLWCGGGVLCPVLGWLSQDQLTKITNTLCGAEDSNPVRQLRNTSGIFRLKSISERHIHVNNHHHKGGQCLRSPALSGPSGSAGQCPCTRSGLGWANQ